MSSQMRIDKHQIEEIVKKELELIRDFETGFLTSTDVNIQRAYVDLKRSKDYLVKYLEDRK